MPRSLSPRLSELRDRLGDSPLREVVGGVRLLRYRVPPGAALPVAEQYARLTGFTAAAAWESLSTGLRCVELRSPADTLSLVAEESPEIGSENAETMTFRRGDTRPALVASYGWAEDSVVWGFVAKNGPRVHHTAFYTDDIAALVSFQREHDLPFTTPGLIGSESRGILQVFTHPLPGHGEIVEYIQRFHGFRGFFDPGNVGELMASTRPFN